MFQRGNDAFDQKAKENTAIKELRSFYIGKNKQTGAYESKNVLHLHSAKDAVVIKLHDLKMIQPDGSTRFIQSICMNEFGETCDCCMKGMSPTPVAIYKVYDFTTYVSTQDNQTKTVGVKPMLARKVQQGFVSGLASADPNGLMGRVVTYGKPTQKEWSAQMCQQQPSDQDLINFQSFMGGYTNEEIMQMIPITDKKTLGDVLAVIARGGAGTANSGFNPNQANNNGGGMNFNANQTFNNGGQQNNSANNNCGICIGFTVPFSRI